MPPSLLLISLGNPGARYALTRHNAGHIVLSSLATQFSSPSFSPSPYGNAHSASGPGLSTSITVDLPAARSAKRPRPSLPSSPTSPPSWSAPPPPPQTQSQWTLHQCPSLMNVSGRDVAHAWRSFLAYGPGDRADKRLCILHDSLEDNLGRVRLQLDGSGVSARGHNGIKSVLETFGKQRRRKGKAGAKKRKGEPGRVDEEKDDDDEDPGEAKWIRVNVGIGRPESRDPDRVADYVLQKFGQGELDVLRSRTTDEVLKLLKGIK
ncbi:hypothetical protein CAC42_618 [Sphaceloma murrayae]|uniref:peptidyl-tRNA hydrolase n=1 Tax=Sphaceloma murrayae TaxID=2082308 RepID=A0A2K1QKF0_9PEZI|nr:hypothetical protein CAC42_618 [Sphaceloma murrayae]